MTSSRRDALRAAVAIIGLGVLGLARPPLAVARSGTATRAVAAPLTYGTAAWHARPPHEPVEVLDSRPVRIVVHHTATDNSDDFSLAHAFDLSRWIQNFHMDTRGWIDTGQHFTNSRGGWITEGRHRSLEVLRGGTRHVVSAHATGQNHVSLGIENEGTYLTVGPTDAQWRSLVRLCAYLCQQYGISPNDIFGHRDFNVTQCPGDVLYTRLPRLRREVAGAIGYPAPVVDPVINWPRLSETEEVQSPRHG